MCKPFFWVVALCFFCVSCNKSEAEKTVINGSSPSVFSSYAELFKLSDNFAQTDEDFDFNGDGVNDKIYYVNKKSDDLSIVDVSEPWPVVGKSDVGSKLKILIVHGDGKAYLISDKNDISVLDTDAMRQSIVIKKAGIVDLEEGELSSKAIGDIILIPTEAGIDSYLYWNGVSYVLYEVIDMP